jgi:hypothetical protein
MHGVLLNVQACEHERWRCTWMWCVYVTGGGSIDARLTVSTMRSACQIVQLSAFSGIYM